jgi:hypothetical protein
MDDLLLLGIFSCVYMRTSVLIEIMKDTKFVTVINVNLVGDAYLIHPMYCFQGNSRYQRN